MIGTNVYIIHYIISVNKSSCWKKTEVSRRL